MAREQVISRTIKRNKVTTQVVDVESGKMEKEVFHISLRHQKPQKILQAIDKELPGNKKAVHIVRQEYVEGLYEMSLDKFIKNAEKVNESEEVKNEQGRKNVSCRSSKEQQTVNRKRKAKH